MTEQDLRDKISSVERKEISSTKLIDKCVQIAKDYADSQNKELIDALKLAYENLNGSADEKVFQTIESLIFKNIENER